MTNKKYGIYLSSICRADDHEDGPCRNAATTKGYCNRHYQRLIRTGDVQKKRQKSRRRQLADATRARELAGIKRDGRRREPPYTCMCSHESAPDHHYHRGTCLVPGCDCERATPVNIETLINMETKITMLGFEDHVADNARCTSCGDVVSIGKWSDPNVLRRGLIHRKQECRGTKYGTAVS